MTVPLSPIEEEINRLEVTLRQLKKQYDIFFSGAAPRQPFETRKEVDLLVKQLANTPMQRFADRYRYNALAGKFQTYCELWMKTLRMKEEGRGHFARSASQAPASAAASSPDKAAAEAVVFKSRFKDPTMEDDAFKTFYDRYLEARRSVGGPGAVVPYSAFLKQIAQKTESIKARSGCASVIYKIVVKEGAVTLKAAPVKERES